MALGSGFLVPRLSLGMPVARLCLDYDIEIKAVCGRSPRDMGSQAELGNQNSGDFRSTISAWSALVRLFRKACATGLMTLSR